MTNYKQLLTWLIGKEPKPEPSRRKPSALDKYKLKFEPLPSEAAIKQMVKRARVKKRGKASSKVQQRK